MREAGDKELFGLIQRGTFQALKRRNLPQSAIPMPGKVFYALKSTQEGTAKAKVRYFFCENRDNLKQTIVHESSTVQGPSLRLALSVAQLLNFEVWNADVTQAYLQSSFPLQRSIYIINPPEKFEVGLDEALFLIRPLHGLCESGDPWQETLEHHLQNELGMTPQRSDAGMFALREGGRLIEMNSTYVVDLLRMGTSDFRQFCRKTHE